MTGWQQVARRFEASAPAHLATLDEDGGPHVVPVWIDREGDTDLVFFTIEGSRKDRNLARDPRLAISITAPDDDFDMATLKSEVVERMDGERNQRTIDRISRKYTGEPYPERTGHVAFVVRPTWWWARDYSDE